MIMMQVFCSTCCDFHMEKASVFRTQLKLFVFVNYFCKKALSQMFDWVLNTHTSEVNNKDNVIVLFLLTLEIFGTLDFKHISHILHKFYKFLFPLFWTTKHCLGSFLKIYRFYIFYSKNLTKFYSESLPVNSWWGRRDISRQILLRNLKVFVDGP